MSETSYNGWPASTDRTAIGVKPFAVAGIDFPGGVRAGDASAVLRYVASQWHRRVEPLASPGCWGYSYRQNRNANNLSCHSSGTAIDINAPKHPNGVEATSNMSRGQIAEVHEILREIGELSEVVHWGGDWHRTLGLTPDPMHFEIHDHDTAKLARVAARIRALSQPPAKETRDMALLADLRAAAAKHSVTPLYAARVLLRDAATRHSGAVLARINAARTALKGLGT